MVIAKELGLNSRNSNDKNGTYGKINSIMESDITNEHKEYLSSHHDIKLNSKMEKSTLIYWMSKCTLSVSKSTHSVLTKMYT